MIDSTFIILVLVASLLAVGLGYVWFGIWFEKKWLEVVGPKSADIVTGQKVTSESVAMYIIQWVLALLHMTLLAVIIAGSILHPVVTAFVVWLGLILPALAATYMWSNQKRSVATTGFMLQAGYYLLVFSLAGFLYGFWL